MAATWAITIAVQNVAEKRARITGVRTDGEDVTTYSVVGQIDDNDVQGSLDKISAGLYRQHTEAVTEAASHAAIVAQAAAALETRLNNLETA